MKIPAAERLALDGIIRASENEVQHGSQAVPNVRSGRANIRIRDDAQSGIGQIKASDVGAVLID